MEEQGARADDQERGGTMQICCTTSVACIYLRSSCSPLQVEFCTADEIVARLHGDTNKAEARIAKAKTFGQGLGKGYFFDTNIDEWVHAQTSPVPVVVGHDLDGCTISR
jgi:hypothetical protein